MKKFSLRDAKWIGDQLGIDWSTEEFTLAEFHKGLNIEVEHGMENPITNITNDDPIMTGKITLAHLRGVGEEYSCPQYNTMLLDLEHKCGYGSSFEKGPSGTSISEFRNWKTMDRNLELGAIRHGSKIPTRLKKSLAEK